MDVITIESHAYQELIEKINFIAQFIKENHPENIIEENLDEIWVDGYDVCTFLKISNRTLQRLRSSKVISYSIISGKCYYTIGEIKRLLYEKRIRSTETHLNDLIKNYQLYDQQRRNIKSNR